MPENVSKRHYFTDLGNPQFSIQNRQLLGNLANAIGHDVLKQTELHSKTRAELLDKAIGLIQAYDIEISMPGLGGPTIEQWKDTPEKEPVETALKALLFHLVDNGYLYREFQLLVWDAVVELQMLHGHGIEL